MQIGDFYTQDGLNYYIAHKMPPNINVIVRDFYGDDSVAKKNQANLTVEPDTVASGRMNIRGNAATIKAGRGITGLTRKKDTAFLLGSGASILKILKHIPELKNHGEVFATNRAMRLFSGHERDLDYAFFCDSKSHLFTRSGWWEKFDSSQVKAIFSTNVNPTLVKQAWAEQYFFSMMPNVIEWEAEEKANGIDSDAIGWLDSGFAGIYSMIHLCARMGYRRVILLGHDFSFVDYGFHFDERLNLKNHIKDHPDFAPTVVRDCHGDAILSLHYLTRTAQVVAFAVKHLADHGVEVYNGTDEGILYAPWIKNEILDIILERNLEVKSNG